MMSDPVRRPAPLRRKSIVLKQADTRLERTNQEEHSASCSLNRSLKPKLLKNKPEVACLLLNAQKIKIRKKSSQPKPLNNGAEPTANKVPDFASQLKSSLMFTKMKRKESAVTLKSSEIRPVEMSNCLSSNRNDETDIQTAPKYCTPILKSRKLSLFSQLDKSSLTAYGLGLSKDKKSSIVVKKVMAFKDFKNSETRGKLRFDSLKPILKQRSSVNSRLDSDNISVHSAEKSGLKRQNVNFSKQIIFYRYQQEV